MPRRPRPGSRRSSTSRPRRLSTTRRRPVSGRGWGRSCAPWRRMNEASGATASLRSSAWRRRSVKAFGANVPGVRPHRRRPRRSADSTRSVCAGERNASASLPTTSSPECSSARERSRTLSGCACGSTRAREGDEGHPSGQSSPARSLDRSAGRRARGGRRIRPERLRALDSRRLAARRGSGRPGVARAGDPGVQRAGGRLARLAAGVRRPGPAGRRPGVQTARSHDAGDRYRRRELAPGTYTVAWRVVSADSDPVSGAFVFHVLRRGVVAPSASIDALTGTSQAVDTLFTAARFFDLALLLLVIGGSTCSPWRFRPPRGGSPTALRDPGRFGRRPGARRADEHPAPGSRRERPLARRRALVEPVHGGSRDPIRGGPRRPVGAGGDPGADRPGAPPCGKPRPPAPHRPDARARGRALLDALAVGPRRHAGRARPRLRRRPRRLRGHVDGRPRLPRARAPPRRGGSVGAGHPGSAPFLDAGRRSRSWR